MVSLGQLAENSAGSSGGGFGTNSGSTGGYNGSPDLIGGWLEGITGGIFKGYHPQPQQGLPTAPAPPAEFNPLQPQLFPQEAASGVAMNPVMQASLNVLNAQGTPMPSVGPVPTADQMPSAGLVPTATQAVDQGLGSQRPIQGPAFGGGAPPANLGANPGALLNQHNAPAGERPDPMSVNPLDRVSAQNAPPAVNGRTPLDAPPQAPGDLPFGTFAGSGAPDNLSARNPDAFTNPNDQINAINSTAGTGTGGGPPAGQSPITLRDQLLTLWDKNKSIPLNLVENAGRLSAIAHGRAPDLPQAPTQAQQAALAKANLTNYAQTLTLAADKHVKYAQIASDDKKADFLQESLIEFAKISGYDMDDPLMQLYSDTITAKEAPLHGIPFSDALRANPDAAKDIGSGIESRVTKGHATLSAWAKDEAYDRIESGGFALKSKDRIQQLKDEGHLDPGKSPTVSEVRAVNDRLGTNAYPETELDAAEERGEMWAASGGQTKKASAGAREAAAKIPGQLELARGKAEIADSFKAANPEVMFQTDAAGNYLPHTAREVDLNNPEEYNAARSEGFSTIPSSLRGSRDDVGIGTRAQGDIETNLVQVSDSRDRMLAIRDAFDPEFQRLPGKLRALGIEVQDFLAGVPFVGEPSQEQAKFYADFVNSVAATSDNFSKEAKALSGVAINPEELKRMQLFLPNKDDKPIEFRQKMNRAILAMDYAIARYTLYGNLSDASASTKPWHVRRSDVSDTLKASLNEVAQEIKDAGLANSDAEAFEMAQGRVEKAFGISRGGLVPLIGHIGGSGGHWAE